MKNRKIPQRMCSVTREKYPKSELLRIVRTPDNTVEIDLTGKINGHGAYIKKDVEVVNKAKKSKVLNRMLEIEINDEIYDKIIEIISE